MAVDLPDVYRCSKECSVTFEEGVNLLRGGESRRLGTTFPRATDSQFDLDPRKTTRKATTIMEIFHHRASSDKVIRISGSF
jgi:hypothetical protein